MIKEVRLNLSDSLDYYLDLFRVPVTKSLGSTWKWCLVYEGERCNLQFSRPCVMGVYHSLLFDYVVRSLLRGTFPYLTGKMPNIQWLIQDEKNTKWFYQNLSCWNFQSRRNMFVYSSHVNYRRNREDHPPVQPTPEHRRIALIRGHICANPTSQNLLKPASLANSQKKLCASVKCLGSTSKT